MSVCKICNKEFEQPWQVAQHVKFEHKNNGKPRRTKEEQREINRQKAREAYKKKKRARKTQPVGNAITINFCPSCGCNLRAVSVALSL